LAAEYSLGTLQGPARRRFERSLKDDPALRALVREWQSKLAPLDGLIEPVQPPARVWQGIAARIQTSRRRSASGGWWGSLRFWRGATLTSGGLVLVFAAALLATPSSKQREMMIVVMSDANLAPHMTISWPMREARKPKLRVRVVSHEQMDQNTSWELWMLPGHEQKPVSLGLINTDETQELALPERLTPMINDAWGLAMSVEPKGGSPTGAPTGPVLYKGQRTEL
jgi:anti-sigma-K factor RskA